MSSLMDKIDQLKQLWLEQPPKTRLLASVCLLGIPAYFMADIMVPDATEPTKRLTLDQRKPVFISQMGSEKLDQQQSAATLEVMRNKITERERQIDQREIETQAAQSRLQAQIDQTKLDSMANEEQIFQLTRQVKSLSEFIAKNGGQTQAYQNTTPHYNNPVSDKTGTSKTNTEGSPSFSLDPMNQHIQEKNNQPMTIPKQLYMNRGGHELKVKEKEVELTEDEKSKKKNTEVAKKVISQHDSGPANKKKENTDETWMSAGTVLTGTLLTGHNVPTGGRADKDPAPVLIKITHDGLMPNSYTIDLKGCIIVGAARGSMSTRRVEIRAESLSCINEHGQAIEQPIMAAAQGPDGLGGIPAKLVTRYGEVIKQSFWAGIYGTTAETIADVARNKSSNITLTDTDSLASLAGSSAAGGLESSFEKIADFYLEMAEEAKPYLEMMPAIEGVDFIVQRGVAIKLKG